MMSSDEAPPSDHDYDADDSSSGSDAEQSQDAATDNLLVQTQLSEETTDEGYAHQSGMTNEGLNTSVLYQGGRREATRIVQWWFTLILRGLGPVRFWFWFVLQTVMSRLYGFATRTYASVVQLLAPQLRNSDESCPQPMNFDRDAQEEGRVAHPTDETIVLSETIIAVGTETEPAAVMTAPDTQGIERPANQATGHDIPPAVTGDDHAPPIAAIDNPTCNINPLDSVESQDDDSSSLSNDEDQILVPASGFNQTSEPVLPDHHAPAGETALLIIDPETDVQNEVPPLQTMLPNVPPSRAATSSHDVADIAGNVSNPSEGADRLIVAVPHQSSILVPKPPTQVSSDGAVHHGYIN